MPATRGGATASSPDNMEKVIGSFFISHSSSSLNGVLLEVDDGDRNELNSSVRDMVHAIDDPIIEAAENASKSAPPESVDKVSPPPNTAKQKPVNINIGMKDPRARAAVVLVRS